jgi:hypothetical protein
VKITVSNCDGGSVGGLAPGSQVPKINVAPDPDGTVLEATSTSNPTTGTTMRYDATAHIYNLATKGLAAPSDYRIIIDDPTFAGSVTALVTLKK